jgi:hypothetical protein
MSAIRQIEAAHARNLAVQRSRLASMPEVGIFWLIDNKLVTGCLYRFRGTFIMDKGDDTAPVCSR